MSSHRPLPAVVGILNVTPDSFSDGGLWLDPLEAIRRGLHLADEGADWIDVGGESTRPGAHDVADQEQINRVVPVVRALTRARPHVVCSVDTRSPTVARAAIDAGATVVNDVSGLRNPTMRALVAERGVRAVVMHSRGTPTTMADLCAYDDVVADVKETLRRWTDDAIGAGVAADRLIVDPGLGFAKRGADNATLVAATAQLGSLGYPVFVGASRKRFVGELTGREEPGDRLAGSLGVALAAWTAGASFVRVHDVSATRDALRAFAACLP